MNRDHAVIYLDHAATAPPRREVLEAMWPYLTGHFANPASSHEFGRSAERALDQAREDVAAQLGARPGEIIFTSGGTESNNAALKGLALAAERGRHILVSAVEHSSVLEPARWLEHRGFEVERIPVDEDGLVSTGAVTELLREDTTLVSVQAANNEVGTLQPVAELASTVRSRGVPFHTDAVQAVGSGMVDVEALQVDSMSLSGHKIGTPKGIGVLYLRRGTAFEPLMHGGGQQRGRRSGTENPAAAVGMAAALKAAGAADLGPMTAHRDAFIDAVETSVQGASLTGLRTHRLAGHASFVVPGRSGEALLLDLERRGVLCSSGSACSADSLEPSHVLIAMGYAEEVAQTALRFSFGPETTAEDLNSAAQALVEAAGG